LADHLTKYPEQLSGGQQQRVAIARAIAMQPDLILADEPTGNLDEATSDEVMRILLELVTTSGAGMLMVTHSTMAAHSLDRRLHLSAGRLA
jgi:putative ABC transport system ATP-binding protein